MPWYLRNLMARGGYMEAETGAEEGGAAGSDGEVSQPEAITPNEDSGPSSLLEAIESGLKVETEAEKTERLRDEQGRFAAKEAAADPAKKMPEVVAKPEDDMTMPEGLSQKAQERFTKLVSRVKEHEAQVSEISGTLGQFREMIQSTGASADEFSKALDCVRMIKHGEFEGALKIIDDQRRQLSLAMGKSLPGADPLAQYPDLRQRVDGYQMDEQTAIELARTRYMQNQQQEQHQRYQQSQQETQRSQQERSQSIQQIDQLGQQWAKSDPDFTYKEDIILKQLPEIAANFPPSMWPQQVRILYNTISGMPMQRAPAPNPAPLRPTGLQGGTRQPKSMLEAMEMGLGYSGG